MLFRCKGAPGRSGEGRVLGGLPGAAVDRPVRSTCLPHYLLLLNEPPRLANAALCMWGGAAARAFTGALPTQSAIVPCTLHSQATLQPATAPQTLRAAPAHRSSAGLACQQLHRAEEWPSYCGQASGRPLAARCCLPRRARQPPTGGSRQAGVGRRLHSPALQQPHPAEPWPATAMRLGRRPLVLLMAAAAAAARTRRPPRPAGR